MTEIALYLLGPVFLGALIFAMTAQLGWQAYRVYSAPILLKINALTLILFTATALWPPHDYQSIDRSMIYALLMLPPAIIAIIKDPHWFKLLPAAHVVFAFTLFYVMVQAAR